MQSEVENASGSGSGGGGALEALATAAVDGGSSNGMNSSHGSPLSTDLCIDESGWYVYSVVLIRAATINEL